MGQSNPLDVLKQCFEKIIPSQDARTTINPMEFVVCLVFCYFRRFENIRAGSDPSLHEISAQQGNRPEGILGASGQRPTERLFTPSGG